MLHALDGAFSEPMFSLVMATFEAKAREWATRLLSVGHTLGADVLPGMRLAWRALHGQAPAAPNWGTVTLTALRLRTTFSPAALMLRSREESV